MGRIRIGRRCRCRRITGLDRTCVELVLWQSPCSICTDTGLTMELYQTFYYVLFYSLLSILQRYRDIRGLRRPVDPLRATPPMTTPIRPIHHATMAITHILWYIAV